MSCGNDVVKLAKKGIFIPQNGDYITQLFFPFEMWMSASNHKRNKFAMRLATLAKNITDNNVFSVPIFEKTITLIT